MKCPNCGRENTEETNFCYYCGYSFREQCVPEQTRPAEGSMRPMYGQSGLETEQMQSGFSQAPDVPPYRPEQQTVQAAGNVVSGKAMPVWQWFLYFLLLCIPYVWPVWLLITGIWAFSEKSSPERRNFSRGILIFLIAAVVFSIITAIILIATMGTDGAISYLTGGAATSADALLKMYGY